MKIVTLLLAGTIILTAGCGKDIPAESEPKEPADADAQNETVFEDENAEFTAFFLDSVLGTMIIL